MIKEAKITSKGQITIPKEIRQKLNLKPGKKVTFLTRGKEAVITPKIEDPMKELKELRQEISFKEEEIEKMIEESKRKWSKIQ